MDIKKLAYDHGANIYGNGEVRFYTLSAFNKFAEAYHQAKCNEEIQTLRAKVETLMEALKYQRTRCEDIIDIRLIDESLATYDKLSEVKHDTK